jgi:hypothetical protein
MLSRILSTKIMAQRRIESFFKPVVTNKRKLTSDDKNGDDQQTGQSVMICDSDLFIKQSNYDSNSAKTTENKYRAAYYS